MTGEPGRNYNVNPAKVIEGDIIYPQVGSQDCRCECHTLFGYLSVKHVAPCCVLVAENNEK